MKLQGMKELQAQLIELKGAMGARKTLARAGRKAIAPVLERAKANAPYDDSPDHEGPHLRDSLQITMKKPKSGDTVVTVGIRVARLKGSINEGKKLGRKVFRHLAKNAQRKVLRQSAHWRFHFVELGTSKDPARPFVRPAFDALVSQMTETIKAELAKDIERTVKHRKKQARMAALVFGGGEG